MNDTMTDTSATRLVVYIQGIDNFTFHERGELYTHMGALISDAILQAGMRYETQVLPRIQRLLSDYPNPNTSSSFLELLHEHTPEVIVNVRGRKASWIQQLTNFLITHKIETPEELRDWLADSEHEHQLLALKGVGLKTVNYLKLLTGISESVAIDTHLRAFLRAADIVPSNDREAAQIVTEAAALLGVSAATLDASIWRYRTRRREAQVSGR